MNPKLHLNQNIFLLEKRVFFCVLFHQTLYLIG